MTNSSTVAIAPTDAHDRLVHLPALDGLRGVAVAVVVAFHAHWLTGGYLGVDLFFVLSGFLITRLLLSEYRTLGRIDLVEFWRRRARRLLPAMIVVICFVAFVERTSGTLDGPAGGRRDVIGALTYTSNWLRLDSGAGYWRQFGGPGLLDHMWSLAIEEQFYLVWPLVLLGLFRLVRSNIGRVVVLGLASCGLGLWALRLFSTTADASRVYMGTDTRAVALLLGATAAAIAHRRTKRSRNLVLRFAALPALMVLAIMTMRMRGDALITYQGGLLACSVAGTLVVAAAALDRPPLAFQVFSAGPLRWLGTRSYGIYLWHWPIMVVLHVADSPESSWWRRLAAVGASLAVAEVSYRVIEQPIRTNGLRAFRPVVGSFPIGLATVAVALVVAFAPPLDTSSRGTVDARGPVEVPLPIVPLPAASSAPPVISTVPDAPAGSSAAPKVGSIAGSAAAAPKVLSTAGLAPAATSTVPEAPPSSGPGGRPPRVMFVGDSVGSFLAIQADREHERLGIEVVNAAVDFCPLSYTPLRRRFSASDVPMAFADGCAEAVNNLGATVAAAQPDVVVMIWGMSFWYENEIAPDQWHAPCSVEFDGWFRDQILRSTQELSSTGATVYWVTQGYHRGYEIEFDDHIDCVNRVAREVAAQSNGAIRLIELGLWVCPSRECLTERDGIVLRPDGSHFVDQSASLANIWMLSQMFSPPPWAPTP